MNNYDYVDRIYHNMAIYESNIFFVVNSYIQMSYCLYLSFKYLNRKFNNEVMAYM